MTPLPNGYVLFQPFIQSLSVDLYLALLNLYLRDPSLEEKPVLSKVVLLLPWDLPLQPWVHSEC